MFLGLSIYLALTSAKVASVLIKRQLFHISFKIYIVSLLLKVGVRWMDLESHSMVNVAVHSNVLQTLPRPNPMVPGKLEII